MLGCKQANSHFCILGPVGPGSEKMRPGPCSALRLVANKVLARLVRLGENLSDLSVWLHVSAHKINFVLFGCVQTHETQNFEVNMTY